jgi:hypothetical protein
MEEATKPRMMGQSNSPQNNAKGSKGFGCIWRKLHSEYNFDDPGCTIKIGKGRRRNK